jgi:predicted ribosomally synthesized peptide with nif11-like leader
MSIESARAFYSRMTTDEAFRTQLEQAASKEERQQILQVAGYDFTPEEWQIVTAEIQTATPASDELSDAQLEAVSGGGAAVAMYGGIWPDDVIDWIS